MHVTRFFTLVIDVPIKNKYTGIHSEIFLNKGMIRHYSLKK